MDWKTGLEIELHDIEAESRSRSLLYSEKLVESLSDIEQQLELVRNMFSVVEVTIDTAIKKFQAQSKQKSQSLSPSSPSRFISEYDLVPMDTENIDARLQSQLAYLDSFRSDLSDFLYKRTVLNDGRRQISLLLDQLKKHKASLSGHSVVDGAADSVKTKEVLDIEQAIRDDIEELSRVSESVLQKIPGVGRSSGKSAALHEAAYNNSLEVARVLIDNGADNAEPNVASPGDSSGQKPAIGSRAGVSSRRVPYRSDLHGSIKTHTAAILEVLSDGNKRDLHKIAREVWEINENELDVQYEKVRRTLSSTLAREVKRRTVFRPGATRGEYSTCRFTSPMQAIQRALDDGIVKILDNDWRKNPDVAAALREYEKRETKKSTHRAAQKAAPFESMKLPEKFRDTLRDLVEIQPLAIPLLGVEMKIIKKNGGHFVFETSDIASIDARKRIESHGEETIGEKGSTGPALKKFLRDNEHNLYYSEDSPVIGYLNENTDVKKEIEACIARFALIKSGHSAQAKKRLVK